MTLTLFTPINQLKAHHEKLESLFQQLFSVFSVAYLCISCGNFLGYTSSAVPSMKEDFTTFSDISPHEISWIGGLGPLGALVGSLFTLIPLPKFGSRRTIAFFGAPALIISWSIIGFANSVQVVFLGRFIGGFGTGILIATSPLYVLDVSSINIRGRLGVLPQFLMIFGILSSYILGSFLSWRYLAISCAIICIPSTFLLAFAPDSPSWLISKNQTEKAFETLERLHGTKKAVELFREIQNKAIKEILRRDKCNGIRKRRVDMAMIKASAVSLGILSFQQLTGMNGVTFYAVSIFRQTAGSMDPHVPSIILASTQLLASFASSLFIERFGRKFLLTVSSVILTIAGMTLGTYFYCRTQEPYLFWVPLATLILFAFGFAIGFGPVSWILIAEILPEETRHIMNPIAISYSWFSVFLVTKSFPLLLLEINLYGIFWLYAGIALVGVIFIRLCVPETKKKSAEEIRLFFGKPLNHFELYHFEEIKIMANNPDLENLQNIDVESMSVVLSDSDKNKSEL